MVIRAGPVKVSLRVPALEETSEALEARPALDVGSRRLASGLDDVVGKQVVVLHSQGPEVSVDADAGVNQDFRAVLDGAQRQFRREVSESNQVLDAGGFLWPDVNG